MNQKRFIDVAAGRKKADLVFKNARIVNVFTREVVDGSIAVEQGKIAGIGAYQGRVEIDLNGQYAAPGLIDSHVHIESALVSPEQFACLVLPHGTTSVIADPHEIANVCGLGGIRYMIDAAREVPLDVYYMVPSCVPATRFENAGAVLDAAAIESIMDHPDILGLGEMMDYPSVVNAEDGTLAKLSAALVRHKLIDGHGPMLEGRQLTAYAAAGVQTDHECSTLEEMRDRLRLGMRVLIREGSAAKNLAVLVKGVDADNSRRCTFCTDDKQPEDIFKDGHIDFNIRLAAANGLDPLTAIQMATINAAEGYGLKGKGAIAPGYDADLVILENLNTFAIKAVYKRGKKVAEDGIPLFQVSAPDSVTVRNTVNLPSLSLSSFKLKLTSDLVHVIHIHPDTLITEKAIRRVTRNKAGFFETERKLDIRKIAVIERHRGSGNIGLGLVEGYGVTNGAVGLSIAHDSHNLVIAGDSDEDMKLAAEELGRIGGGIILVKDGRVLDTLPLPIAGLMTNEAAEKVNNDLQRLNRRAYDELSVNLGIDPIMMLSFLTLPVIPELKITDKGLFDVIAFDFIDINTA
ncbi:MAG: adenine deaminase [spirochete symbiont of Stewartia floridana]|nr:MAG: adenine deaminase [spirochete symbiont of Stewartia floridana]